MRFPPFAILNTVMYKDTSSPLIDAAKSRMRQSSDPIHDYLHAERTAAYAERLGRDAHVTDEHREALVLAAWWHDVARTITEKPSFIWMPFVDDLLSAMMLLWHTVRTGTGSRISGLAIRLIACKSIGTGALLTRIFVRRKNRILIDTLYDADKLDFFNLERMARILKVTESSAMYRVGYRMSYRWFCIMNYVKVKTDAAKKYIVNILQQFLRWFKEPHIYSWHVDQFSKTWARKNLRRLERMVERLTRQISSGTI